MRHLKYGYIFQVFLACVLMLLIAAPCPSWAQPQARGQRFREEDSELRSNILTLMMLRLNSSLNLTEEQSAKLLPVFNRIEREKMDLNSAIMREINALRMEVSRINPDLGRVEKLMLSVREKRDAMVAKDKELEEIIGEELTVLQQANHMIFMDDFLRNLRQRFNRAKMMNQRRW